MSATFKPSYGTSQSITISANSLGSGSSVFSTAIDNSSSLYQDVLVSGTFKAGSSGVSATGTLLIIVAASTDGGSTYPSNVADCKVLSILSCVANNATPFLDASSIASLYGGVLPQHFQIGVVNNSGAALASTANSMNFQGVNDQALP